jgi:hypothetical protein
VQKNEAFYLLKKKKIRKITIHKVYVTKLLFKILYSIFSNKSYSIDDMGNLFNICCDIVDRK